MNANCNNQLLSAIHFNEALEAELQNEFSLILSIYKISHFWLSRYYLDGRFAELTTDVSWKKQFWGKFFDSYKDFAQLYLSHVLPDGSYSTAWALNTPQENKALDFAVSYGFRSGYNYIKRHKDSFDCFGFSLMKDANPMFSFNSFEIQETLIKFGTCMSRRLESLIDKHPKVYIPMPVLLRAEDEVVLNRERFMKIIDEIAIAGSAFLSSLSPKEKQILKTLSKGATYKIAAQTLKISHRTVESHVQHIMNKTEIHCKTLLIKRWNQEAKNIF